MRKLAPGKWLLIGTLVMALGSMAGYFLFAAQAESEMEDGQPQAVKPAPKPEKVAVRVEAAPKAFKADPFFRAREKAAEKKPVQTARQDVNLPPIPNFTPPEDVLGEMPLPQFENREKQVGIQGILQGQGGKNIAILSDGRIVSEGDSYQNSRIAVIGGAGIVLSNGEKIAYETEK